MNTDKALAEFAEIIIKSYNGSYKPHLLPNTFSIHIKHTEEGYVSVREENERELRVWTECVEPELSAFIKHFFLWYGKHSVDWSKIITSSAVIRAVIEWFGIWINENACDAGYEFKQYDNPHAYIGQLSLCGIYQNGDEWVFIHQNYFPPGDNPNIYLHQTPYPSLIALVEGEVIRIGRKIRLKVKGKS